MADTKISALSAITALDGTEEFGVNNSLVSEKVTALQIAQYVQSLGSSVISPAQITADQDNYNPTGWDNCTILRLDGDNGIRAITSFAAPTTTTKPHFKKVVLIGSYPVYYPGEHPDGTAANRIASVGRDVIHYPGETVDFWYDTTSTRWRIVGSDGGYTRPGIYYSVSAASATGGDWGQQAFLAIGTGTKTASAAATTIPIGWLFSTASSGTAGFTTYFPKSGTSFSVFGSAHIFAESLMSIPTLSDGTETFTAELQLRTDPSAGTLESNNMYGIRYSSGINGGEWELFSQDNSGTETVADLNIAVVAATLYKLRLEVDKGNTEVRAYINGVYVGRVAATMANAVAIGAEVILLKSAGTTARTLQVHNFSAGAIYPL